MSNESSGERSIGTAATSEIGALERAMASAPPSLAAMFWDRVEASGDREAFRYKGTGDKWTPLTWKETADSVSELAAGLITLGVDPQDRVAIASNTRIEWILADLAVVCAGAATTTVYPTMSGEDVEHILADSAAMVVVAEDVSQLEKIRTSWERLPALTHVVLIDPSGADEDDDRVLSLDALCASGRAALESNPEMVRSRSAALGPGDLATLIYTSGTTGRPKGVRLTHSNWVYEGVLSDVIDLIHEEDLQYLWLPLAHSFGKVLLTAQVRVGFCSAVDGDVTKLVDNLAVVRPTVMAAAPRIFEKVYGRVVSGVEAEGGARKAIFNRAVATGRKVSRLRLEGKEPGGLLATEYRLADKLVFTKLRDRFGGRIRYFISGSAALSPDLAEWFHAAGITVLEGYGLTETSAATFVNRPDDYRFGVVGPPVPGTEVRIAHDGEILVRGPGVMEGYHNLPDATAEMLVDGWLHTGDIGELVEGRLRITDRKKDLIKTSGGKYVAPSSIESLFKATCPYLSQVVVHGEGRRFVSALIALDPEAIEGWAAGVPELSGKGYDEIVAAPQTREMVNQYVDQVNARLGRWETIKQFVILPQDLTVDDGSLTASLKVRRRVVEKRYQDTLDAMYSE